MAKNPLFYVNFPSISDPTMALRKRSLFILIPIAPGIEDSKKLRKKYFNKVLGD